MRCATSRKKAGPQSAGSIAGENGSRNTASKARFGSSVASVVRASPSKRRRRPPRRAISTSCSSTRAASAARTGECARSRSGSALAPIESVASITLRSISSETASSTTPVPSSASRAAARFNPSPVPTSSKRKPFRLAEPRGAGAHAHAGFLERRDLVLRRALAAGDDRAGVAHAAAGRRRLAGDEGDDGLLHVLRDVLGGLLLGAAADLADHDQRIG